MKNIFTNTIIASTCLLLTGISSTLNANTANQPFFSQNQVSQHVSYTASGTTDRKTALLFKRLLKENKNLEIHAEVIKKPVTAQNRQVEVEVNYTVNGKTDMKTVRKLIHLFKSNKEVEITATANVRRNIANNYQNRRYNQSAFSYNTYNQHQPIYYTNFINPNLPPIIIQGNTMWYPMPVNNQQASQKVSKATPKQNTKPMYPQLSAAIAPFPMDDPRQKSIRVVSN